MAPPKARVRLTAAQIEDLAAIGCTDQEIAVIARVSEPTLQRRYDAHLKRGRARLRERLRRQQLKLALDDNNVAMAIWLGKQYLGQRDRHELGGDDERPIRIETYDARAAIAAIAPGPAADRADDDAG